MKPKYSYEERITSNKKIQSKIEEILIGIDAVAPAMEDDRRHWQASEELRQLQNMRHERGVRKCLRTRLMNKIPSKSTGTLLSSSKVFRMRLPIISQ
jgi:hypothetical protein